MTVSSVIDREESSHVCGLSEKILGMETKLVVSEYFTGTVCMNPFAIFHVN